MSFWEDRFVNRPHAGAAPPGEHTDPQCANPIGSAYPQFPSSDAEPTWVTETHARADELDDSIELAEVEPVQIEDESELADENPVEPIYEYRRKGLFRRRQPVLAEAVPDDAEEHEAPAVIHADELAEGGVTEPETWNVVSEPEQAEDELDKAEDAESEQAAPDEKRGLFGRRKHVTVESAVDPKQQEHVVEVEDDPEGDPEDEIGHSPALEVGDDELAASADVFDEPAEERDDVAVFGQDESASADSAAEAEPAPDQDRDPAPEHELVAEGSEHELDDDAFASELESAEVEVFASGDEQPVEQYGDAPELELSTPEVYARDDEQSPVADDAAAVEAEPRAFETPAPETPVSWAGEESAGEDDSADEYDSPDLAVEDPPLVAEEELVSEPEPVDDWYGSDDFFEEDVEESDDVDAPLSVKKRNGSGPRGKKVVGLKVGASQLAAAVVSGADERPALVDVARRSLEPGVVVGGELRDADALVHALKAFFKESGLPTKNIRLGLSSSRVGVRTFEIAGVEDEARFDNAVRFKAHEVLPVAAHESVLDYRVIEERYTESGEISRRVLLVVAPRDQVEPYVEACRSAGLRLAGVDLEAFGLLRSFVPPFGSRDRTEDSATVVVSIGHEASTLLVAGGGISEFTRVFDWGGGALQTAIADELEVPHMEAATILSHLSLSGPGRHLNSLDEAMRSRALEVVRARLTPFARELVSSLQFYQTQPDSLGIREILITGGTAHFEGLADALHQMIGVSVSVGDPLGRVDVQTEIPAALDATIGSLAVPIGLAIEDETGRSVNLMPKESRQTRKRPSALAVAGPLAAALPLLALAFMFIQASSTAGDKKSELNAVRAEIDALPEPTKANIDPALAGEQASRATAVAQILGGRLTWERVLGDVSRVLPTGVSLRELTATTPPPSTPVVAAATDATTDGTATTAPVPAPAPAPVVTATAPSRVTVTGYALDYATVARTLARLQAVPSLTNAELQSATPSTVGKKRIIDFTIVATLAMPGGVQ